MLNLGGESCTKLIKCNCSESAADLKCTQSVMFTRQKKGRRRRVGNKAKPIVGENEMQISWPARENGWGSWDILGVILKKEVSLAEHCSWFFSCPSDFWRAGSDGYFIKLWHQPLGLSMTPCICAKVHLLVLKFTVSRSQGDCLSQMPIRRCSASCFSLNQPHRGPLRCLLLV